MGNHKRTSRKIESNKNLRSKSRKSSKSTSSPSKSKIIEKTPKQERITKGVNLREAKGWKEVFPKKGRERKEMIHRCGSICFLLPSQLKFPVCRMSRRSCAADREKQCECIIDRRGVIAAKFRAKQYGYTEVEAKADRLLKYLDSHGLQQIKLIRHQDLQSIRF